MSLRRARRLLLPLAACALAFATIAAPAVAAPADPAPLLLRLPDVGPGYVVISRVRSCSVFDSSIKRIRQAFGTGTYRGCLLGFTRAWTPPGESPGPGAVHTLAVAYDGPAAPTTVLSRPRALFGFFFDRRDLRVVEPAPAIGDQAVLMRVDKTILGFPLSAGAVAWRSGSVLGMVVTASVARGDANAQAAVRLAALQQARIANPTSLRPPVNDDRLVLLDDPTLGVPVMWLGEQLPVHGRFPALDLRATDQAGLLEPAQLLVRLIYGAPHRPHAATVDLWRPRALHRLLRRPIPAHLCQRRSDASVPGARAWIVATLRREPRRAGGRCPHNGASVGAVAFFDDVAVTIDAGRSRTNAYNSRAGLRRVLRALRPRPLPTP